MNHQSLGGGPWKIRPGERDVLLCLENARRLRRDAKACKSPAKLALLELSIEQAAIGAMLFFRLELNDELDTNPTSHQSGTGADSEETYSAMIRRHAPQLTDQAIIRAAWKHPWSLREARFVLEMIESQIPRALDSSKSVSLDFSEVPPHLRPVARALRTKRGSRLVNAMVRRLVDDIQRLDVDRLDKTIKNNSLYVRVNPESGGVTLPEMRREDRIALARTAVSLEKFIRGLVIGRRIEKARSARRELTVHGP